MTETWRPIAGFEDLYEVSDHGRIRSLGRVVMKRNRWGEFPHTYPCIIVKPDASAKYLRVLLSRDKRVTRKSVHVLVSEAFIGPRPEGFHVCHNDGDHLNNRADNLRYDTPSGNMQDLVRHGNHAAARKTHCPQGHPYDEANTWRATGRNQRICRACCRVRARERYRRQKAVA